MEKKRERIARETVIIAMAAREKTKETHRAILNGFEKELVELEEIHEEKQKETLFFPITEIEYSYKDKTYEAVQTAIQLGLELCDTMEVEFADGTIKKEMVFSGLTKFGEEVKKAMITLTESRDALIGTKIFSYLEIDFNEKVVGNSAT